MKYSVIIPCGGRGSRLNLGYNKILYLVDQELLIEKTIKNFLLDIDLEELIIVYQKDDYSILKELFKNKKVILVEGGDTRANSVLNGLKIAKSDYVLIHDGARPNVSKEIIERVKEALMVHDSVIPVVKCKDASLLDGFYHFHEVTLIQTPQGFNKHLLLDAMQKENIAIFRDEGSIMAHHYQVNPFLVAGDYNNIKVTTKEDLKYIMED